MDFSKRLCNDGIMLEPRLMDYINRKKAYKKGNIASSGSLERQCGITKEDIRTIKKYMKGKNNLYTTSRLGRNEDLIDITHGASEFQDADDEYKKDPRYKRLQNKMKTETNAQKYRHNQSQMDDEYNCKIDTPYNKMSYRKHERDDAGDRSFMLDRTRGNRNTGEYRDDFLLDTRANNVVSDNPNYIHHPTRRSNMYHHKEPRFARNSRLRFSERETVPYRNLVDNIVGEVNQFTEKTRHTHNAHMPYIHTHGFKDANIDNYVHYGVSAKTGKSVGYKNPFEHQFQYIDPEIQHPDHVVSDRGIPTRQWNTSRSKYKREMMP